MPVETAADLAGMFDSDEFAERANYQGPGGGAGTDCVVIVDRGQGRQPLQAPGEDVTTSERKLWAQASEIEVVHRDGTFTMLDAEGAPTGEVYRVAGMPSLDHTAALWSADLVIVS